MGKQEARMKVAPPCTALVHTNALYTYDDFPPFKILIIEPYSGWIYLVFPLALETWLGIAASMAALLLFYSLHSAAWPGMHSMSFT